MIPLIERWRIAVLEWALRTTTLLVDRGADAWEHADKTLGTAMATVVLVYSVVILLWAAWLAWLALETLAEGIVVSARRWWRTRWPRPVSAREEADRDAFVRAVALAGTTDGLPRSVGAHQPEGGTKHVV